ncbi:hypothetical protein ACOQFV_09185 [Nocardiopsis changdeensis]|uniref:ABC transporter permease n=1 Tax=Nocardiopsis changdeensis TaxID=2831969 RepID=A0ABX8BDG3_9ACTN|nr:MULTISPECIES: hypothetical protein [Nocardiopsis]QUX20285.1 hypothetical protein KGD84_17295 [Nocardiopsis changdeensis]QYX36215.1 hypothetical protein K1J57_26750 [Nocardiopsis sp. MT53]
MAPTTTPPSDDVALAEIREFEYRLGELPGRNQLMSEFGWGASRSTRLLGLYKEQREDRSGWGRSDYPGPGPVDGLEESVRSETDQDGGPQSGPVGDGVPVRPEESADPVRPVRSSRSTEAPVQSPTVRTGQPSPDRSSQSGSGRAAAPEGQSGSGPVRQSGQVTDQTGAVRPTPQSEEAAPVQPQQTAPVARVQADAPPVHQTAPTPDRTDQTTGDSEQTTAGQTGPQTGGSDRQPYGLIAATLAISLSAFTAVWGGWVGLGRMVGFGPVNLLPGIGDGLVVDLAITLPIGIEAYAAAALWVAVGGLVHGRGRWFAGVSAGAALGLGAFGQAVYHLLEAQGHHAAPDWVVVFVSILPVVVLGAAGVLLHLVLEERKSR